MLVLTVGTGLGDGRAWMLRCADPSVLLAQEPNDHLLATLGHYGLVADDDGNERYLLGHGPSLLGAAPSAKGRGPGVARAIPLVTLAGSCEARRL